jgi:hypothetical protein
MRYNLHRGEGPSTRKHVLGYNERVYMMYLLLLPACSISSMRHFADDCTRPDNPPYKTRRPTHWPDWVLVLVFIYCPMHLITIIHVHQKLEFLFPLFLDLPLQFQQEVGPVVALSNQLAPTKSA